MVAHIYEIPSLVPGTKKKSLGIVEVQTSLCSTASPFSAVITPYVGFGGLQIWGSAYSLGLQITSVQLHRLASTAFRSPGCVLETPREISASVS